MSASAATVAVSRGSSARARGRARAKDSVRGDQDVATRARRVCLETLDRVLQRVEVILGALGDLRGGTGVSDLDARRLLGRISNERGGGGSRGGRLGGAPPSPVCPAARAPRAARAAPSTSSRRSRAGRTAPERTSQAEARENAPMARSAPVRA